MGETNITLDTTFNTDAIIFLALALIFAGAIIIVISKLAYK
jgi:hypothetical protein